MVSLVLVLSWVVRSFLKLVIDIGLYVKLLVLMIV